MINCSPLRIGSGKTDGITDMLILKDKDGRAFIPATSLAGVLRSQIADIYSDTVADKLFGSIEDDYKQTDAAQSMINISDVVLDAGISKLIQRDGVKIDEITGVGKTGAKYDFEALDRGAKGSLSIEITVRQNDINKEPQLVLAHVYSKDAYDELAAIIADMLTSGISVGSLTTKGYGEIRSIHPAKCYVFDFNDEKGSDEWLCYLNGSLPAENYAGDDKKQYFAPDDFCMNIGFSLYNSLIVRDYDSNNFTKQNIDDNIAAIQMTSGNDYIIPGTSIKGAVKNKAFDILMALSDNDEKKVNATLDEMMGFANDSEDRSQGMRSSLYVKDAYISKDKVHTMKQTRNRIDRFTGGTIDNALFADEPIWQNDRDKISVYMDLRLRYASEAQAGLMLLILRELWLGNLAVGGGKSIGRGVLKGKKCTIHYKNKSFIIDQADKFTVEGDKAVLESYVKKLAGEFNG